MLQCPKCGDQLELSMEDLSITDDGEVYKYYQYICRHCWYSTGHSRIISELEDEINDDENAYAN